MPKRKVVGSVGGGSEVAERSYETLTASLGSSLETQPEALSLHGFPEKKNKGAHRESEAEGSTSHSLRARMSSAKRFRARFPSRLL